MSGNALLDTNVFVRVLGGDPAADACLRQLDRAYLCMIVMGELWHGAENSARPEESRHAVEKLAKRFDWLPGSHAVAVEFGRIKHDLRKRGRPIPENDVWIAAFAKAHSLLLLTNDQHFAEVDGLKVQPV
jgi:tRNA(fMet)-specific endonuclease VapC